MIIRKPWFVAHLLIVTFAVLVTFAITSSHAKALTLSSTNYSSHLIDNYIFTNNLAMSASQIQTFLQNEGSGLASYQDYVDCSSNPSYMAQYYPCGKNAKASAIIYDAGQAYGMNPQVVLATMQKEQILVTTPNPTSSQLKYAMGYGCADSTGCTTNSHPGFFNQVDWATWQLRLNVELMSGRSYFGLSPSDYACNGATQYYSEALKPGNDVRFYDDNGTYYNHFVLPDASTASLYCYTPHVYNNPNALYNLPRYGTTGLYYTGSYNFAYYFTLWFGSTYFPQPLGATLYRQTSTGKIYIAFTNDDGSTTIYYIPSWSVMTNFGLNKYATIPASDSTISSMTDGGTLYNTIRDSGGSIYLVNDGKRDYIPSASICTAWGLDCFNSSVTQTLGQTFETGYLKSGPNLTSIMSYGGVYYLLNGGARQPFANTKSLTASGYSTSQAIPADSSNVTQPLSTLIITTPGLIKFSPKSTIYYFDGNNYYDIPGMLVYNAWALGGVSGISAPTSSYNRSADPPVAGTLGLWYQDGSGNKYVVDSGKKYLLNTSQQAYWTGSSYTAAPNALANRLAQGTLNEFVKSGINFYQLTSGTKDYIPTIKDYLGLGGKSSNTTYLNSDLTVPIDNGPIALANGHLLKIDNGTTIYAVYNKQLLTIPDMNILWSYNFTSGISHVSSASLSGSYTVIGALDIAKTADGSSYFPYAGQLLFLTPSMSSSFGAETTSFQEIDSSFLATAKLKEMTVFLRNSDNGKIYYASGGAIHYVTSISSFKKYGGDRIPVTSVSTEIINSFTLGQPI